VASAAALGYGSEMTVICRNAEKPDLKPAMAVVAAALNDLEGRHGFEGISDEIDTS
jgi:hypothetical protein